MQNFHFHGRKEKGGTRRLQRRISPLSVPFAILCTVFSKNVRLNAILIQHTGSLHRFFIFHNILFVNKQKQEKYICLKLHIEKSGCHPLS